MMFIKSLYYLELTYYSPSEFLNFCHENYIILQDFSLKGYKYYFWVDKKSYKKIKKNFKEVKLIKSKGLHTIFQHIKINFITILLLIFSFVFYLFLNTRVFMIEINGSNRNINQLISNRISSLDIKRFSQMPTNNELKELEILLKMELINYVDLLTINSQGTYIYINYQKKGDEVIIEEKKGKMYAKKSGIIKSFDIESGKIMKEINDYVNKGDLIVDDTLYYKDKEIKVGTIGKVWAYTFNKISLSIISKGMEESEVYQILLSKARYNISKNFQIGEYIDKEIILSYINQNGVADMVIHYTLVENICSFSNS